MVNINSKNPQSAPTHTLIAQSTDFKKTAQLSPSSTPVPSQSVETPVPGTIPTSAGKLNTPSPSEILKERLKNSGAPAAQSQPAPSSEPASKVSLSVYGGLGSSSHGIIQKNIGASVGVNVGDVGLSLTLDQYYNTGKLKGQDVSNETTDVTLGASIPIDKHTNLDLSLLGEHYNYKTGGSGHFFTAGGTVTRKIPIDEKTSLSVRGGVSFATDKFQDTPSVDTVRFDGKFSIDHQVTSKLSINAFTGVRQRVGVNEAGKDDVKATPTYLVLGGGASYSLDDKSSIGLAATYTAIGSKNDGSSGPLLGAFGGSPTQNEFTLQVQASHSL